MLEIAKSNSKTSNNSARLIVAALAISVARLAATTLAVPIIAAPLKLTTLIVLVIVAPFKCGPFKAIRDYIASNATWSNYIKGVLGKLVNVIIK
jgi:hypothetical protein